MTEPDPGVFGRRGRFGRGGAAFVPDVPRASEPQRLSGPVQFVVKLLEFWRLDDEDAVRLLGFDGEDAAEVAAILAGRKPLRGRDVRERIAHLIWIRKTLSALFRHLDTENAWLRESHRLLDNRSPMELLLGGSIEDMLSVRDYADAAGGV